MTFVVVILGLAALILIHEFGHFITAKLLGMKVEEFGIGFPPRLFKKRFGETDYSVNLLPFGGFVRLQNEDGSEKGGFNDEPARKKIPVILAGIFMNLLLGWLLLSVVFAVGAPQHLMILEVAPGSPASAARLLAGDVVSNLKAGDMNFADPISSQDFTGAVKGAPNIILGIERGSKKMNIEIAPRLNPPEGQGPLGVNITETGFVAQPISSAFVSGFTGVWETSKMVIEGLVMFFGQLFTAPRAIENVAGPVGIVFIAAQATSLGFIYLIQLLALISVNLAVLNLLPFPALDGGRFLFLIIEKIIRRPISKQFQIWVNGAGFAALILLMVFITVKDVVRFF
ncbi:MAG: site-2 protease family protein [Patescibacteria group bacterium]